MHMDSSGIGGGVMLAIAAALWMVYLVPTWLRRREYFATERNAVRLQQTIRVLAETAEVPDVVRAGMSPARGSAQRVMMPSRSVLATARGPLTTPSTARRLRRTRAVTSLVLLASLIAIVGQVSLVVTTGAVIGSWLIVGSAALVTLCSFALLGRLAELSRARRSIVTRTLRQETRVVRPQPAVATRAEWSPVPIPKPLYLSRAVAERVAATDSVAELRAAALAADRALRAAQEAQEVVPILKPTASRFATMGLVDASVAAHPDLDAVLRLRRAAG